MSPPNAEEYYNAYKDAGFHFPTSTLTTYALSLHTKPFTILSGISGTGKTKIAQLFQVPGGEAEQTETVMKAPMLTITIPRVFDRFNFHQALIEDILTPDELATFNANAKAFRERGDGGNFSDTYVLDIEDTHGTFQIGIYGQRATSPLIRGRYYKSREDRTNPEYDARNHLRDHYNIGDILKLEKIDNKRYRVTSINDQEVVKIVRAEELETINRNCFIPVRSDWTDNTELFGFYNLIEQKYHVPYFLEFLLTALNHPEHPFFVILDEMNLSKVEHYFSDILSCLESRTLKNGEIHQEKIILHSGISQLATDSESYEYIPNMIEVPLNIHFTGTVNIDESTYMFSPKVLDRANVIEFNEVNLVAYGSGVYEDNESYKFTKFPDFNAFTFATKDHYESLPAPLKSHVVKVNDILQSYNLHFGYRTANELALYIHTAMEHINNSEQVQLAALDHQFVQKVFPKLNGGYALLEAPLHELLLYLSEKDELSRILPHETPFPITIDKLQRMYRKLSVNGYANFID